MAGVWPAGHALGEHEWAAVDGFVCDFQWRRQFDDGFAINSVNDLRGGLVVIGSPVTL